MKRLLIFLLIILAFSYLISASDFSVYKVKKGDNLSSIAKAFRISLQEIIKINQIDNPDLIYPGQELKIPANLVEYQVQTGDSLWEIAQKYKTSLKEVLSLNKIKDADKIFPGQILLLPQTPSNSEKRYQLASRSQRNNFIWPVQGEISSLYGWRIHPIRGKKEFHTGLDIAVAIGSPVYAAAEGVVVFSGWSGGYGQLVIIEHPGNYQTYYAHNLELLVKEGDYVQQGRIVALSGNTGVSTGPHLHFEIRINNRHADPLLYLNREYLNNGFRV